MPVRQRVGRSAENIARIDVSVPNDPNQPISRHSQELCIVQATLWRFLRKDLGLHIYKIKLTQELKPMGHTAHDTIGLLKSKFDEHVISRNDPVNWPSRSCDLTPLDLFHWFMPTR